MPFTHQSFVAKSTKNPHHYSFAEENVLEGGRMYAVFSFPEDASEALQIAETLFDIAVTVVRESTGKSGYDRLEDALRAVNMEYKKLRPNMPTPPSACLAYFDFHTLHLSQSGSAEAYLMRGNELSQITESVTDENKLFQHILTGDTKIKDIIVLSTVRILRYLTTNQVVDIFAGAGFTGAVDQFRHELTLNANEDILVDCIGIGTNEKPAQSAGFMSKKVVSNSASTAVHAESPVVSTRGSGGPMMQNMLKSGGGKITQTKKNFQKVVQSSPQLWRIVGGSIVLLLLTIAAISFIGGGNDADEAEMRIQKDIGYEALSQAGRLLLDGSEIARSEASQYLERAEKAAKTIMNTGSDNYRYDALKILEEVQEKRMGVENAEEGAQRIMADLSLKADNVQTVGMMHLRDNLYPYSRKQAFKVVRNIVSTIDEIVNEEEILSGDSRDGQNTLVFLTSTPRVVEYREGIINRLDTTDDTWQSGIELRTYLDKFIYILDPANNQIWKYERLRTGYGPSAPYNINSEADLSRSVGMAIDGAIYVLTDEGKIMKFSRGELQKSYAFQNLPSVEFSGPKLKIFTTASHDLLYVLDPDNKRILLFEKGSDAAIYKRQVLFSEVDDAVDFYVSESGLRAYISGKEKVHEVEL